MSISSAPPIDLTNCDREPIHIPGLTQPHGVLFVLQEPELQIVQVSQNTLNYLGLSPEQLLNQPLNCLLEPDQIALLRDCCAQENLPLVNPIEISLTIDRQPVSFDGIIHRSDTLLVLELEPHTTVKTNTFFNFYHTIKLALAKIQGADTLQELCNSIVQKVRSLNGFDRVMIYKFDADWNGAVIAEDKRADLNSYLGLHYPASDIPSQARSLYAENWLRIIPNVHYQPVPLVPELNPVTQQPLDLSGSVLRSVSPLHVEYLSNMGVAASMSISILKNKQLWGLIACHHESPKYVPYEIRNACEFLGQITSLELANKEDSEDYEYKMALKSVQTKLIESMSCEKEFTDGLVQQESNLLKLVNATGAAICVDGQYVLVGTTPPEAAIQPLLEWIGKQLQNDLFYTHALSKEYPAAEAWKQVASGVMALSISKVPRNYLLWFRPEVLQTIHWAGNPDKPVETQDNGAMRLSPRKSFELWKQTVRLQSLPWKPCEIEAVLEFRNALVGVVLRKADELAQLNVELQRSNSELDAFAYIASHDLKEPLRGIHNYSNFLIEDYGDTLDEEGVHKLKTLIRLTQRMEDLIDSLLHFSRLGRVDLSMQRTNLNEVLHRNLDLLSARMDEDKIAVRIPQALPTIYCDRIQVGEVFNNLISNAIKYNDKAEKWIEIGLIEAPDVDADGSASPTIFYVKDNGIGIKEKHFDAIFRIFKRLHGPQKYGGGTGAGLTIAKKIVERHGGKIWVESTLGEGTTFYFTLSGPASSASSHE